MNPRTVDAHLDALVRGLADLGASLEVTPPAS
jgi:hypothetical protein